MLEPEIENILKECRNIEDIFEYSYIIRNRIFTGQEVLDIFENYIYFREEKIEAVEKLEERLENLKEKYFTQSRNLIEKCRELKEDIKKLINDELIEKNLKYEESKEKLEAIIKKYKGPFIDELKKILND